jgi:hypothetical protein
VHLALDLFARRCLRRAVAGLLTVVLLVQVTSALVFGVLGPAHVHTPQPASPVLIDFRRVVPSTVGETHGFGSLAHFHQSASPQRHHHARGDPSVHVIDDQAALQMLDADEQRVPAATIASLLAWIPAAADFETPHARDERAWHPLWAPLTAFVKRLDRPPKSD